VVSKWCFAGESLWDSVHSIRDEIHVDCRSKSERCVDCRCDHNDQCGVAVYLPSPAAQKHRNSGSVLRQNEDTLGLSECRAMQRKEIYLLNCHSQFGFRTAFAVCPQNEDIESLVIRVRSTVSRMILFRSSSEKCDALMAGVVIHRTRNL
jgi:hypothetical protein